MANRLACNAPHMTQFNIVHQKLVQDLRRIPLLEPKAKLPGLCCVLRDFSHDIVEVSKMGCKSESSWRYFKSWIDGYTQDIMDMMCGSYTRDSKYCQELVLPNATIKGESPLGHVPVMIHILETL